jgi:iron complex outermembrane receptor protein
MKKLIILFFVCSTVLFSQTQTIKGRILNSSNKNPIPFVNILNLNTNFGTTSNEEGFFELDGIISKNDLIKFSHVGYETKEILTSTFIDNRLHDIYLESKVIISQTILVKGSIAKEGITPISFSKLTREDFEPSYTNQDIPELLSYLPSTTFYSENGNGLGYNYLSIRGFDQRRISVSINGISQNDPEDHNVYWLDFPDLLESTDLIQVQRGAGSGIIGYPAIGGSINIITSPFSDKPRIEFSSSIGSYNTRKYSAVYSSGIIDKKYSLYGKISQLLSSGYRNSSWVDFKSYHFSVARYDEDLTTQINIFGGPIADGLAYNGLPKFAIKNPELRKENYSYWVANDKQYLYTATRKPQEIENFSQPHFQLLNEFNFSNSVKFNSALFLILGNGFFDYDGSWADSNYFRLTKENGFIVNQNPGNSLIRAMVENKQIGWIPRLNISHNNGELVIGGELRFHNSIHWGSINYAENLPYGVTKDYRYYYYEGGKDIISFFANENYRLNDKINFLFELQLAYHKYRIENEKYLDNEFSISGLYLNPRVGINYKIDKKTSIYFSIARVTREPRLKNYYDAAESSGGAIPQFEMTNASVFNFSKPLIKPETMTDIELGSHYSAENLSLSLNLFYMNFTDEIVKKGQLDRFGQPITGNMESTIHYGLEGLTEFDFNNGLKAIINGSISKNYIKKGFEFREYNPLSSFRNASSIIDLSGNRISGFPDVTFNFIIKYSSEKFFAQISNKYVGAYFSDNYDENLSTYISKIPLFTDYTDNKVESYFVTNLFVSYEFTADPILKYFKLFIQVNNLFDNLYASYGIGKEFFPAAERNFLFGVKLSL